MNTFTFSDTTGAIDFTRELARFRRALVQGRPSVDVESKAVADDELYRRIHAFADANEITFDRAATLIFQRARADSNSENAALLAISRAGLLQMINHPAASEKQ